MVKKLKITLKRSLIGRPENQRRTAITLGLGRVNSSVIKNDTEDVRGKVKQLEHLLTVEEIDA